MITAQFIDNPAFMAIFFSIFWALIAVICIWSFAKLQIGRGFPLRARQGNTLQRELRQANRLPSDQRSAFFLCTFSLLGKLAASDGSVTDKERERVEQYIQEELQLSTRLQRLAVDIFNEALEAPIDYREYIKQFRRSFPDRVQLFSTLINLLLSVSASDGTISESEDRMLRSVVLLLDFTEPYYENLKLRYIQLH